MQFFQSLQLLALVAAVAGTRHLRPSAGTMLVALDKDMKTKMMVKVGSSSEGPGVCSEITCGELKCPSGFTATKPEGHCCPYCIDPDLKIEKEVKGASGKYGGELSPFCEEVWCFPTMCAGSKEVKQPTASNGQCCSECPL